MFQRYLTAIATLTFFGALGQFPDVEAADSSPKPLRVGMIGLDTSHVIAFTQTINNPKATGDLADITIVAGYPGGTDLPASKDRVEGFTERLREMGIEIVETIPALLEKVDVVMLESVDGRTHLKEARLVIAAGKPIFIDKPVAGSLADAVAIFDMAKKNKVPCFSASSLRYYPGVQEARHEGQTDAIVGCATWGPCSVQPEIPDMFFYGIHGIESLFTIMGPGCETVTRVHTDDTDLVVGVWRDGRIGTYRGIRANKSDFGAIVFGGKRIAQIDPSGGYEPLVREVAKFFKTGKPPVAPEETIEIFAFMEAADESKRKGGAPVSLESVLAKAKAEVDARNR